MAKAKTSVAVLSKPKKDDKGYTKTQLIAHIAESVSARGFGELNKKQAAAVLEELADVMLKYAPVGANLPGIGKLVVRETPARPQQKRVIFGEERVIPRKPKGRKLVFRLAKSAKDAWNK
jgi:nucleoid DNA-binding protein